MVTSKHILFLTSTNLSSNPRCLKEIKLVTSMGWQATVVAFNLHNWTDQTEQLIKQELPGVQFYYLNHSKKEYVAVLLEKAGRFVTNFLFGSDFFSGMGVSRRSWILLNWCRQNSITADLIVAHNPATFYPAFSLSKKKQIPFALDIEDYHPGEGKNAAANKVNAVLMSRLMPLAAYNSFAAPLIMQYAQRLLKPATAGCLLVNNVFSVKEFAVDSQVKLGSALRMVWFSQFIDYGRGLEKALPVLDAMAGNIELTLIGDVRQHFYDQDIRSRPYITLIKSLPQESLNLQLGSYDIGLALEDAGSDVNRNICLTNKIWAYFQAGLFIWASDTEAQVDFLQSHPGHGTISALNENAMKMTLEKLLLDIEQIRNDHSKRFETATQYCWENESKLLKDKWRELLQ